MIIVLGVGNLLLKDEGFGVEFANKYKDEIETLFPGRVEVVEGGTQHIPLLPFIENAEFLIIIDVVKASAGQKPGDIVYFTKNQIMDSMTSRIKITSHSGGIHELLATSEFESTLPDDINLIGVIPEDTTTKDLSLTKTLSDALPRVKEEVLKKLNEIIR